MVLWRYGGHSKYNCVQLRANFHRFRAWFKFPHIHLFCFMIIGLIPQDVLSQWQWRNPKGYGWHQLGSHNNKHTKAKTAWDHIIPTLNCVVLTIPQVKWRNHICEDWKILSFFYLPYFIFYQISLNVYLLHVKYLNSTGTKPSSWHNIFWDIYKIPSSILEYESSCECLNIIITHTIDQVKTEFDEQSCGQ